MSSIPDNELKLIEASFNNLKIEISMDVKSSKIIKKVADYSLLDLLGAGAYGKVYLALKAGKFYAIKVIPITSEVEYDKNCKEIEILSIVSPKNIKNFKSLNTRTLSTTMRPSRRRIDYL